MSLRIGIAGFGRHARQRLLPVIEAEPRLQLAGVWCRSETSQHYLQERGIKNVTADFARFLASDLDVVYLATPSGLHAEHATAILRAGHHAWVEKPLATTLEDLRGLLDLAEAGGLMLAEAFMFPWHAQAAALRRILAADELGKLRSVTLTFCFPQLPADDFRHVAELGGGAYLDHACYLLKALDCYLGGQWRVLGGCSLQDGQAVDVRGGAQLYREADGVIASLHWGFGCSYVNEIQLLGEHGRLLVESAFTKPATRSCQLVLEDSQGRRSTRAVRTEDPYQRMIEGFIAQLQAPQDWPALRDELLAQGERYFALRSSLRRFG